jgi:hypothetical protein
LLLLVVVVARQSIVIIIIITSLRRHCRHFVAVRSSAETYAVQCGLHEMVSLAIVIASMLIDHTPTKQQQQQHQQVLVQIPGRHGHDSNAGMVGLNDVRSRRAWSIRTHFALEHALYRANGEGK